MERWNQVVGHEWAVASLRDALRHGRLGHAYLITGPDQVGKTTLARTFAQALNCTAEPAERPCHACRVCKLIAADRHPDVRVVEPDVSGRGKLTLKIEAIRDLLRDLNLSAYEARRKVAILKRFDVATIGAANAFLKTLEEPPPHVVLLLTASDADTLLPTIASRCRTLNLRPLAADLIEQSLTTRWHVPEADAALLAHLADGRLGWAVRAAQEPAVLQERADHLSLLHEALAGGRVGRFQLAEQLARRAEALPDVLKAWLSWWRDLLLLTHARGSQKRPLLTNSDELERLQGRAEAWSAAQALACLKQTSLALWQLEHNANTRLVLENLLLLYPLPDG